ncbi:hypothetical protein JW826_05745 [Candidatus Woesearchaeota archaeon]|nr:hypothetical protein [Candidatus Woesearchaeota archaeon]
MNPKTLDKIFVALIFGMIFVVLSQEVVVTGRSVAVPDLEDFVSDEQPAIPSLDSGLFEEKKLFFSLEGSLNVNLPNLHEGVVMHVIDGLDTYGITVLHVVQDYSRGDEYVNLLISPGDKRLRLGEGEKALVDFDNDGKADALLRVESIARSRATLSLKNP